MVCGLNILRYQMKANQLVKLFSKEVDHHITVESNNLFTFYATKIASRYV